MKYEWYNVILHDRNGHTVITPEMVDGCTSDEPHTGFEEFDDAWNLRVSHCEQNGLSIQEQKKVTIVRETREILTEDEVTKCKEIYE